MIIYGGVSSSRNMGIDMANGTYIIFVDSDDYIDEYYVENLVKAIDDKNIDILMCGYSVVKSKNEKDTRDYSLPDETIGISELSNYIPALVDSRFILSPWAKIYVTKIIKGNNIRFDTNRNIGEDLIFNLNYIQHCNKIGLISYIGYNYVIYTTGSLTKKIDSSRIESTEELFHIAFDFCNEMNITSCIYAFSKYYYKSHLNFIENEILNSADNITIRKHISIILNQKSIKDMHYKSNPFDVEYIIYKIIFGIRSINIIFMFCKVRIFVKKKIRGF